MLSTSCRATPPHRPRVLVTQHGRGRRRRGRGIPTGATALQRGGSGGGAASLARMSMLELCEEPGDALVCRAEDIHELPLERFHQGRVGGRLGVGRLGAAVRRPGTRTAPEAAVAQRVLRRRSDLRGVICERLADTARVSSARRPSVMRHRARLTRHPRQALQRVVQVAQIGAGCHQRWHGQARTWLELGCSARDTASEPSGRATRPARWARG